MQPGYPENATWGADNVVIACAANFVPPPCPGPAALSTFVTVPVFETAISMSTVLLSSSSSTTST